MSTYLDTGLILCCYWNLRSKRRCIPSIFWKLLKRDNNYTVNLFDITEIFRIMLKDEEK